MRKKQLAIRLSQLKTAQIHADLEQYMLSGDLAAEILMIAHDFGDIRDKKIADLGCGTGFLGIGGLLLGAHSVHFVDCDCDLLDIAKKNLKTSTKGLKAGTATFDCCTVESIEFTVDTVVQNPPFGTKKKGADLQFLKKATMIAPVVYSLHKKGNAAFLDRHTGHVLTHIKEMRVPLFRSYSFHEKKVVTIEVELLRFEKVNP
jgi:putative methylase